MDKYHSWELGAAADDECDLCRMDKGGSGCCRDEVKVLKLQQDVFQSEGFAYHFALPLLVSNTTSYLLLPFQNVKTTDHYFSHHPPLISKEDTYLDNCVFRI